MKPEQMSNFAIIVIFVVVVVLLSLLVWKMGGQTVPVENMPFFYGIN